MSDAGDDIVEEEVNEMEVVEEAEVEDANAVSRFWILKTLDYHINTFLRSQLLYLSVLLSW